MVIVRNRVFLSNCAPHSSCFKLYGKKMSKWYKSDRVESKIRSSPTCNVNDFDDTFDRILIIFKLNDFDASINVLDVVVRFLPRETQLVHLHLVVHGKF
jgi:hypothetical protein